VVLYSQVSAPTNPGASLALIAFVARWHMPRDGALNALPVTDLRLGRCGRTLCEHRETYGTFVPFV
jgi:hypothetical protein